MKTLGKIVIWFFGLLHLGFALFVLRFATGPMPRSLFDLLMCGIMVLWCLAIAGAAVCMLAGYRLGIRLTQWLFLGTAAFGWVYCLVPWAGDDATGAGMLFAIIVFPFTIYALVMSLLLLLGRRACHSD